MDLKSFSVNELKELAQQIKKELLFREQEIKEALNAIDEIIDDKYYTFNFESKFYRKDKKPYVAILSCVDNKIQREFIKLDEYYGRDYYLVTGTCSIPNSSVYETRTTKGNTFYIVDNLQSVKLGSKDKANVQAAVYSYVKNDITKQQLFELLKLSDIKIEIPNELKDD